MEKFFYRVEEGDSILSLSQKFNIPIYSLINDNDLKKQIKQGDLIFIDGKNTVLYAVQPFDSADLIAKKFCISKEKLLKDNGVSYVFYGLILKIDR